ncbi:MAG: hypothetical protein LBE37_02615 [Sphingobacterium sp.]|jgi:hypothetical protein|nr:hypothetical protein [Sphingobacterium sp.]
MNIFQYRKSFVKVFVPFLIGLFSLLLNTAQAQFTITENFRGQVGPDIKIGDDARLTSGVSDPVGAGWLRLTTDDQDRKGYAYINRTFPSTLGLLVDFEYKMWRTKDGRSGLNQGGDGFSIYLFDGSTSEADFKLGGYGGSLGYARNAEGTPALPGLKNGYLGIGFDAFGNFVNKSSPQKFTGSNGSIPNSIVVRGRTTAANDKTSNAYLKGITISGVGKGTISNIPADADASSFSSNAWQNHIDYNKSTGTSSGSYPTSRPSDGLYYRRVQLEVIPTAGRTYLITLRWMREGDTSFTELMSYTTTDVPPDILKVGFAASTGWAVNYHEIRNLVVTTPGNLRVSKLADKDVLRTVTAGKANEVTYTIEVNNDTDARLTNVDFKDRITDGVGNLVGRDMFVIDEIKHSGFLSGTALPATSNTNEFTGTLNMAAKTIGRITVKGRLLKVPVGNVLVNSATALPTDITDEDLENNTSVVQIPVIAEGVDLVVSKTVDEACLNPAAGNTFTVTLANMGSGSIQYGGASVTGSPGNTPRSYTANRLELSEIVPPGATIMSSTVPDGWELVGTKPNTPNAGYTTYVYQTKFTPPTSGSTTPSSNTLESGSTLPAFTFKLKANTSYTNEVQVRLVQENGTLTYSGRTWTIKKNNDETSTLEPLENRGNNSAKASVLLTPGLPLVQKKMIYYCQGEIAVPLQATATGSDFKIVWYSSLGGVPLNNAPTPITTNPGTTRYYVSQTNGSCESGQVEVDVIVLATPIGGKISGDQELCGGVAPNKIASNEVGSAPNWPAGTKITYRWEKLSPVNGAVWSTIAGANAVEYTPMAENTVGVWKYRRVTVPDFTEKKPACETASNEVSITVKNCLIISNPMLRSRARK